MDVKRLERMRISAIEVLNVKCFSRESGRNGEGGKSHALSNKPTLCIQSFHSSSTSVYVSVVL